MGIRRNADKKLCERLAKGEIAEFAAHEEISAARFRELILGVDIDKEFRELRAISQSALHIRGGRVAGRLRFDNMTASGGGALPALIFENCVFTEGLTLAHSHFARLVLRDCRFEGAGGGEPTIDLEGLAVASDVIVEGARHVEPDGLLWMFGRNMRIDGDVTLNRSTFRVPPARENIPLAKWPRYAVSFAGAEITGSLSAFDDFSAHGGISIGNAHICSDVWLSGAYLEAVEGYALNGQSARIDGALMMDARADIRDGSDLRPFRAVGTLWLLGVQIGTDLFLNGARVWGSETSDDAVTLHGARIGKRLSIQGEGDREARILGTITFASASIGEHATFNALVCGLRSQNEQAIAIDGSWAEIRQQCMINACAPLPGRYRDRVYLDEFLTGRARTDAIEVLDLHLLKPGEPTPLANRIAVANARVGSLLVVSSIERRSMVGLADSVIIGGISATGVVCEDICEIDAVIRGDANFSGMTVKTGSLKLSGLRFSLANGGGPATLDLSNVDVAKSITVSERHDAKILPRAIRRRRLACLPGHTFVEAAWDGEGAQMTAHVVADANKSAAAAVTTLYGRSPTFHEWNARRMLKIGDTEQAEEFLRLFTAYVSSAEGAFRIVEGADDLDGVRVDEAGTARELQEGAAAVEAAKAIVDPDERNEAVARAEEELAQSTELAKRKWEDVLALIGPVKVIEVDGRFHADVAILHGTKMFVAQMRVSPTNVRDRIAGWDDLIEMAESQQISPVLAVPLDYRGKLTVRRLGPEGPGDQPENPWPHRETLRGMEAAPQDDPLGPMLAPFAPGSIELGNALVNLVDAQCDTLEDSGGRDWGGKATLSLDRFTYRHAEGIDPAEKSARAAAAAVGGRWETFWNHVRERLGVYSLWQRRYDWLLQQFTQRRGSKVAIDELLQTYSPQPFEQIIRVARAAGDETTANKLEIRKNRIEGRMTSHRIRPGLAMLAVVVAAIWIGFHGCDTLFDWAVAVLILVFIAFLVDLVHLALWLMFGYLRSTTSAIVSLFVCVAIGWIGVHTANARQRMVLEIAPMASSVGRRDARPGSLAGDGLVRDIACDDDINEPLYALDVFIPLIDLRQEGRCAVGIVANTRVPVRQEADARFPNAAWRNNQAADFRARTLDSRSFWEFLKAAYGVVGWIVVSLSIVTFTHFTRKPSAD